MPTFVKQNLYTVKITTYNSRNGEKPKTKQGESSALPQHGEACSGQAGGAAQPRRQGFALSPRRLARCLAAGGRKIARTGRAAGPHPARRGARGGGLACRAHSSFRRSQRT